MKFFIRLLTLFLCASLALAGPGDKKGGKKKSGEKPAVEAAEEEAPAAAEMDPQARAMMDAYMKAGQPGLYHRFLAQFEGRWKAVSKAWMGPGEPLISEGEGVNRMIFGGRYLHQEYHGKFMDMDFEGMGLLAFDNVTKQFATVWIDSMSTCIATGTGTLDEQGKVLTTTLTFSDPLTGAAKTSREVLRVVDEHTHVMEMYETGADGKETLTMEITYTRGKK
ncbi:MAG: DUF1579 domain-containing protein [Acidobacteria bacterium]|nr:DUF1579 domain-containing protein [Acidobacteriota bacterium]